MKPKIYATANQSKKGEFSISYYIIEKDPSFLDWLSKILVEILDIPEGEEQAKYITNEKTEENPQEEIYIKEIKKMIDIHEKYSNNKSERIDVFYGKERVYLTLISSRETQKKLSDFIKKTKEWINIEEIQKIHPYIKKIKNPKK